MRRRNDVKVKKTTDVRIIVGCEDMVMLPDVRDSGVVENLKVRLHAEQIYTYIGHVLVICNPYKWLNIYDNDTMKKYVNQSRVDVSPHIFNTAEAAYRSMITEEDNQCVIISGESGAGKTEASKQIQNYIAGVCGGGESVDKIKEIFLESNPVLEAFGNAKTLRNNNSSRFGKYFELKFNRFGLPQGGVITNYLLEKSRIVKPHKDERNFHIFYQLLASKHISALKLKKEASNYVYLSSGCSTIDGINDAEEFDITLKAMKNVGMKNGQIQSVLSLLASILHLGNVQFKPLQVEGAEGCKVTNLEPLYNFCELLEVDSDIMLQVLTYRELQTMAPGGRIDTYQVPQNPIQAGGRRDAISKALYERMFDLIVSRINVALDPSRQSEEIASNTEDLLSIGVLDIYGFEVFENNGFEQLCINYVNEKLQQIFIELTLRSEQDEYEREKIAWEPIPYFNNRIVCELLDGVKPSGLFRILDDTCKTMHGARDVSDIDKKFIETSAQVHGKHAHFSQNTRTFQINHYAGNVVYSVGTFGESNKDALNKDLIIAMKTANEKLVKFLFKEEVDLNDKKAPPTSGNKIRSQCQDLVKALMDCSPHYVRCIKSNDNKKPLTIDQSRVIHQTKYLGLTENIKVRRAGFAYRAEFHRFLDRFCILSKDTYPEWKGSDKGGCQKILKEISSKLTYLNKEECQLGSSKIFIRKPESYFAIEKLRERRLGDYVVCIQKCWRLYSSRKEYVSMENVIATLYNKNRKSRRRESIFRPFSSDYLSAIGEKDTVDMIREGIFSIVDHYDSTEAIVFSDYQCIQIIKSNEKPAYISQEAKLLVLTNAAIYLIDMYNENKHKKIATKQMPCVILRRRIPLDMVTGIHLSLFADSCLAIGIKPVEKIEKGIISHWVDSKQTSHCSQTGKQFGLFERKHHCRVSGQILVAEVCNHKEVIPDLGWYIPQRISDEKIGKESIDVLEDVFLLVEKKSEFIAMMDRPWLKCNKKENSQTSMPVYFNNILKLRPSSIHLSQCPVFCQEISFVEELGNGNDNSFKFTKLHIDGPMIIQSSKGLSQDIVEEKKQRQLERRKKIEKKRKKENKERLKRMELKEHEREQERLIRLQEKKEKKQRDKESRRSEEEQEQSAKKTTKSIQSEARKFGSNSIEPQKASSQSQELAAAMEKRRAKNA